MTALEAKRKADAINSKLMSEQYIRIKKRIDDVSGFGGYHLSIEEELTQETEKKLLSEGFKIKSLASPYNSTISWK